MDNKNPFYNTLSPDYKLTRAASYSEISSASKIKIQQKYEATQGNLTKQYSCEQIFNDSSNSRQLRLSQTIETKNPLHENIWKTGMSKNVNDSLEPKKKHNNTNYFSHQDSGFPNHWFSPSQKSNTPKQILAPPKLNFNNKIESDLDNLNLYDKVYSDSKPGEKLSDFKVPLPPKKSKSFKIDERNFSKILPEVSLKNKTFQNSDEKLLDTTELKKKLRSLAVLEQEEDSKTFSRIIKFLLIFTLTMALSIIPFFNIFKDMFQDLQHNGMCNSVMSMNNIPEDLKNHVFGQDEVIKNLTNYFVENNEKNISDLIILIGPHGVGKTYVSELIKNNLKNDVNIINLFPFSYKTIDQADHSLSTCKCNLIGLDNLKKEDLEDLAFFTDELKKRAQKHCILIMAIISDNISSGSLSYLDEKYIHLFDKIFKKYNESSFSVLNFNSLTEDALTKCINDAANYAHVKLSNEAMEYVKKDLKVANSGCKGAYSKVQIVGKPIHGPEL